MPTVVDRPGLGEDARRRKGVDEPGGDTNDTSDEPGRPPDPGALDAYPRIVTAVAEHLVPSVAGLRVTAAEAGAGRPVRVRRWSSQVTGCY
jgi:hypothetical protein